MAVCLMDPGARLQTSHSEALAERHHFFRKMLMVLITIRPLRRIFSIEALSIMSQSRVTCPHETGITITFWVQVWTLIREVWTELICMIMIWERTWQKRACSGVKLTVLHYPCRLQGHAYSIKCQGVPEDSWRIRLSIHVTLSKDPLSVKVHRQQTR